MSDRDDLAWVINRVAYNGRPDDTEPSGMDYEFADVILARYNLDPILADHRWVRVLDDQGRQAGNRCADCGLWDHHWYGGGCPKRGFAVDSQPSP